LKRASTNIYNYHVLHPLQQVIYGRNVVCADDDLDMVQRTAKSRAVKPANIPGAWYQSDPPTHSLLQISLLTNRMKLETSVTVSTPPHRLLCTSSHNGKAPPRCTHFPCFSRMHDLRQLGHLEAVIAKLRAKSIRFAASILRLCFIIAFSR
jgi:hypothetical protein